MKRISLVIGLLSGIGLASSAHAQVGLTGSLGTPGIGLHLTVPVQQKVNARIGFNALSYSYDGSTSDLDYDFKLKLRTVDALIDYYPMNNLFRVSGGLVYNGNKIDAEARPNAAGTYVLNNRIYSAADAGTIEGKIDFRRLAPYLGIGWGNALTKDRGWGFSADLGVLFQGSPRTSLTNTGCTAPSFQCDRIAADVAVENEELRDDADEFKFYPVLRVGMSYRF